MSDGHLFIVNGDITRLACDAWLLPTDEHFNISPAFAHAYSRVSRRNSGSAAWPEHGCLLADGGGDGSPDVWLVDVGRTAGTGFEHFVERATTFVATACREATTRLGDRRPLVALPVIGSGDGGKRSERGALLGELVPALQSAAQAHGDVILVTFGEVMYSAAQTARTQAASTGQNFWPDLTPELITCADDLASVARKGKLVTFLGAGVSVDAGLPLWRSLLQQIAVSLGVTDLDDAFWGLDPRDQATVLYRSGPSPDAFDAAVTDALTVERYSLAHGLLASMPISEVVTTNFDDLFELAATSTGRELSVIPGDDVRNADRWLLKLHGTLGDDVVLTRSDYLGAASMHGALRGLVQALLMTRTMLFVGYGLTDEDFHQLVHDVRTASDNDQNLGTVLSLSTPSYFDRLWHDLSVVSLGTSSGTIVDAARRQLIFLDRIASTSMTSMRFAADDSFASLRSEDEAKLARMIGDLDDLARSHDPSEPGWSDVHAFINRFRTEG